MRWLRLILTVLGTFLLVVFASALPAAAADSTLYVDSAGNCSDSGSGTAALPFCTLTKAASKVVAGSVVSVSAGTYDGQVSPAKSGTSNAPIMFLAQPGENVIITSSTSGFKLSSRSWITIDGFIIQGTGNDGIYVSGGGNLTITNNTISYSGSPQSGEIERGIYLSGVSDSTVSGNATHHNTEAGIYLASSTNHLVVSGNSSWANARGYVRAAPGIDVRGSDNVITGNTTFRNEDTGLQFYSGSTRNTVTNNLSYDNGDHGIDDLGATNQVIVANTVFHNVTAGINLEGGSTGGYVANNISVDNGIDSPRTKSNIRVDATSTSGTTLDWNLTWLNTSGVDYIWGSTSYSSLSAFRAATGMEAHGIEANPQFVNSAGDDFGLTLDSPAVDSAFAGATSQPSTDLLGKPRVDIASVTNTGAGPHTYDDRGALELQSTSEATTTSTQTMTSTATSTASATTTQSSSATTTQSSTATTSSSLTAPPSTSTSTSCSSN